MVDQAIFRVAKHLSQLKPGEVTVGAGGHTVSLGTAPEAGEPSLNGGSTSSLLEAAACTPELL